MKNLITIGGKSYKKHQLIMLPTEKVSPILLTQGKLYYTPDNQEPPKNSAKNQHLYILSDENIKEADWVYNIVSNTIFQANNQLIKLITDPNVTLTTNKKIIATTDKLEIQSDLSSYYENGVGGAKYLPRPSDDFLKAFVKAQGKITEVLVEYVFNWQNEGKSDMWTEGDMKVKVVPDGTITIKPIQEEKTSWSQEEVKELMESWMVLPKTPESINNWIKENL